MRQKHRGGEKIFVDYAGMKLNWIDTTSGEIFIAEIFVGCLGASQYLYCEATATQQLPDWLNSHIHMFEYFNGISEIIVPDNLKSGVTKSHRYDPDINANYQHFAEHYGVAIVPARSYAPKDKAKVENGVGIIERQILAPLRNMTFTSLGEINLEIKQRLSILNNQSFQKMNTTRRELYEQLDRPALKPLPPTRYAYAVWKKATTEHMPQGHQEHADFSPRRLQNWATKIGEHTAAFVNHMISSRTFPEQAYRACLGLLRLSNRYGELRLDRACQKALLVGATRYQQVEAILKNNLEEVPINNANLDAPLINHENIRGPGYYQ